MKKLTFSVLSAALVLSLLIGTTFARPEMREESKALSFFVEQPGTVTYSAEAGERFCETEWIVENGLCELTFSVANDTELTIDTALRVISTSQSAETKVYLKTGELTLTAAGEQIAESSVLHTKYGDGLIFGFYSTAGEECVWSVPAHRSIEFTLIVESAEDGDVFSLLSGDNRAIWHGIYRSPVIEDISSEFAFSDGLSVLLGAVDSAAVPIGSGEYFVTTDSSRVEAVIEDDMLVISLLEPESEIKPEPAENDAQNEPAADPEDAENGDNVEGEITEPVEEENSDVSEEVSEPADDDSQNGGEEIQSEQNSVEEKEPSEPEETETVTEIETDTEETETVAESETDTEETETVAESETDTEETEAVTEIETDTEVTGTEPESEPEPEAETEPEKPQPEPEIETEFHVTLTRHTEDADESMDFVIYASERASSGEVITNGDYYAPEVSVIVAPAAGAAAVFIPAGAYCEAEGKLYYAYSDAVLEISDTARIMLPAAFTPETYQVTDETILTYAPAPDFDTYLRPLALGDSGYILPVWDACGNAELNVISGADIITESDGEGEPMKLSPENSPAGKYDLLFRWVYDEKIIYEKQLIARVFYSGLIPPDEVEFIYFHEMEPENEINQEG